MLELSPALKLPVDAVTETFAILGKRGGGKTYCASVLVEEMLKAVLGRGSVTRVEPDELVWASEIAQRLGRTRQSVRLLIDGRRGPGGFPQPAASVTRNPLWRWSEVADWFERYEDRPLADPERSAVIGAFNGALETRRNLQARPDRELTKAVKQLLAS